MAFLLAKTKKKRAGQGRTDIKTLHKYECKVCPLNKARVDTPKMAPVGHGRPHVYFLTHNPTADDDARGTLNAGGLGRLLTGRLNQWAESVKVRYNTCVRTYAGKDGRNRKVTWQEVECCRPSVIRDIEETKPKLIVLLGSEVLAWAMGTTAIFSWRGRYFPIKIGTHTCWATCTYHPRDVQNSQTKYRRPLETDLGKIYLRDINRIPDVLKELDDPFIEDPKNYLKGITCVDGSGGWRDIKKIRKFLHSMMDVDSVAFDYETNGLRPYIKDAKILSVAIGTYENTYAIAMDHKEAGWSKKQRRTLDELLEDFYYDSKCKKAAHNLQFEHEWTNFFYGPEIIRASRFDDTMAQAYCLDERSAGDTLQLDILCLIYFGFNLKNISILDKADMANEPLAKILPYNGMDTKYTHALFLAQEKKIGRERLNDTYDMQLRRIATMVLTQDVGLRIDFKEVSSSIKKLDGEIKDIEFDIAHSKIVKGYLKTHPEFNPGSNTQILEILRESGLRDVVSSDEAALKDIGTDFTLDIIDYRKHVKLKSTYVDVLDKRTGKFIYADGKVHSSYKLLFVRTGRTSSEGPNMQNQPKRGEGAWTRKHFIPPKGHYLVSVDYGQIEARVIAMASKDKAFIKALWDDYDIHTEWAEKMLRLVPAWEKKLIKEVGTSYLKEARQLAKNKMVFPAFFGARSNSIDGYLDFKRGTLDPLMEEFWDTFSGVKAWQDVIIDQYNTKGYTECLTGRRRHAPISSNQIINTPIQGTASDITINAMDRLSEASVSQDKPQYQPIWNIHDDIAFYIPENTFDADLDFIINKMLNVPFDFVNVPISVEVEATLTNWSEMNVVGQYASNT